MNVDEEVIRRDIHGQIKLLMMRIRTGGKTVYTVGAYGGKRGAFEKGFLFEQQADRFWNACLEVLDRGVSHSLYYDAVEAYNGSASIY